MPGRIRALIAALAFIAITLVFIDYTGTVARSAGWLASWQLAPAILALNIAVIAALVILTLIFGRIYCSVFCPLGVMQDGIWWLRRKIFKPRRPKYRQPVTWLRYTVLGLLIVLLVLGGIGLIANTWAGLLDPYSIYGRIASGVIAPGSDALMGAAAEHLAAADYYYIFAPTRIVAGVVMIVGATMLLIVGFTAWRGGRIYCTDFCPVGTLLGLISRKSLLHPYIDGDKCIKCRRCERQCRSHCIDAAKGVLDTSRCVVCLHCLSACEQGELHYGRPKRQETETDCKPQDRGRRTFLTLSGLTAGALLGHAADGGFAPLIDKQSQRVTPVTPAGSGGIQRLSEVCTACGLCIAQCPQDVLVADTSLDHWMQPQMDYTRGYCRPTCNKCGEICPTGAIRLVDAAQKTSIQVGLAVVNRDTCVRCGQCEAKCPTGAISMVEPADGRRPVPMVDPSRCIGCGA